MMECMGSKRTLVLLGVLAGLVLAGLVPPSLVAGGQARAAAPPAVVRQRITVTASAYHRTYATLRVYQLSGKKWVRVFGPWTARVGYNGVARPGAKREGDGTTPAGTYGFSFFFGVQPSLGFRFPFRHAYSYDYWDDDPASPRYNEWVDARQHSPGARPGSGHEVGIVQCRQKGFARQLVAFHDQRGRLGSVPEIIVKTL